MNVGCFSCLLYDGSIHRFFIHGNFFVQCVCRRVSMCCSKIVFAFNFILNIANIALLDINVKAFLRKMEKLCTTIDWLIDDQIEMAKSSAHSNWSIREKQKRGEEDQGKGQASKSHGPGERKEERRLCCAAKWKTSEIFVLSTTHSFITSTVCFYRALCALSENSGRFCSRWMCSIELMSFFSLRRLLLLTFLCVPHFFFSSISVSRLFFQPASLSLSLSASFSFSLSFSHFLCLSSSSLSLFTFLQLFPSIPASCLIICLVHCLPCFAWDLSVLRFISILLRFVYRMCRVFCFE